MPTGVAFGLWRLDKHDAQSTRLFVALRFSVRAWSVVVNGELEPAFDRIVDTTQKLVDSRMSLKSHCE